MWLIAGLGNPGAKYAGTRHNIGFIVVDRLAERGKAGFNKQFNGEAARVDVGGERCVLLKPLTFMNLSGNSVQPAAAFFKIPPSKIIVVHDEIDLDLGQLKLKIGGGHGGHNGIRHISEHLGPEFYRVRSGVGRPKFTGAVTSHVLGGFAPDEQDKVSELVERSADAIELIVREGLLAAQNRFHEKKKKKAKKAEPTPEEETKISEA